MATKFTLFPQLITELRLQIWELALPTPPKHALYPYRKGCWVIEDLGGEPDPNGEDLYMFFKPKLLEPLHISLPLYYMNREARSVAVKYIQQQKLETNRSSSQPEWEFLRPFNSEMDTLFFPTGAAIDEFIMEFIDRMFEPDMEDRYFGTSGSVLPRVAIGPSCLERLARGGFEDMLVDTGRFDRYYIVENADDDFDGAGAYCLVDVEDAPCAHLTWSPLERKWQTLGDQEVLVRIERLVVGLGQPTPRDLVIDVEFFLVRLERR